MSSLAEVLEFNYPDVEGIRTDGAVITAWPSEAGPEPTAAQITQMTTDFAAIEAAREIRRQVAKSDSLTVEALEKMVAVLVSKGVIQVADLGAEIVDAVNARRALRGDSPL